MRLTEYFQSIKPQRVITDALGISNRTEKRDNFYKKVREIEAVADDTGSVAVVVPKNLKTQLLSTIDSAGDSLTEREALDLLRSIIEREL